MQVNLKVMQSKVRLRSAPKNQHKRMNFVWDASNACDFIDLLFFDEHVGGVEQSSFVFCF